MMRFKSLPLFLFCFFFVGLSSQDLSTYFSYSDQELEALSHLHSEKNMTYQELNRWDKAVFDWIDQGRQSENTSRIIAYLYVAQREAACLSYRIRRQFEGSFDPISKKVLALFFPFFKEERAFDHPDPYSNTLGDIVMVKIQARWREENHGIAPYSIKKGKGYWVPDGHAWGLSIGSWKPWIIASAGSFRLSPPQTDTFWKEQLVKVKESGQKLTLEQKRAIRFWSGMGKGAAKTGNWIKIANEYMKNQHVELPLLLSVRSILAMSIEDATIAALDSKYTYCLKSPSMMDASVRPLLPRSPYPGYPSNHAAVSSAASAILSHFFPQAKGLWNDLAREAQQSRIWSGLHFPVDSEAGVKIGEQVGQASLAWQAKQE